MIDDVLLEFLEVAFHTLLHHSKVYPDAIFDNRKKYGAPVKYSLHPDVNAYIADCLRSIRFLLCEAEALDRVAFCVLRASDGAEIRRFMFDVQKTKNESSAPASDHYLVRCEQNLRAMCLKIANCETFAEEEVEDEERTFAIKLYTTENGAVRLAKAPELEHFPFVEFEDKGGGVKEEDRYKILPIHSVSITDECFLQMYEERFCA